MQWLLGIILGEIICESSNWQHIQRLKITIPDANWQLFRLQRIAKFSYFILPTQNIKFYWFEMKIKKVMLPIWWYNRGLFPLGNKYFGVFVLNGLTNTQRDLNHQPSDYKSSAWTTTPQCSRSTVCNTWCYFLSVYYHFDPGQKPLNVIKSW